MGLAKYKQKRSFAKTPEPSGRIRQKRPEHLEFVVQKHNASHLHYDFRLEMAGVLKSWAVPKGPSMNPRDKRLAMMVEDHPYDYRKFEGTIPKGNYGAGEVIVWDKGIYLPWQETDNPEKTLLKELKTGKITFVMLGEKLKGEFALIRKGGAEDNTWLLIKKKDEYASSDDITKRQESVLSGKRLNVDRTALDFGDAPKAEIPRAVKPMLATLTDTAFDDDDWIFEIKWDGYRAIGSWDGKQAELYSRNGNDFKRYAVVVEALRSLQHRVVLDGEIIAADDNGQSNFGWLQNYQSRPRGQLLYYAFDLLWCDGYDLTQLPLIRRKEILKQIIKTNDVIRYSDHISGQGSAFFKAAEDKKMEGIMAKHSCSKYTAGLRSRQWLKIKTHQRQEAVIGGFTEPKGSRKHIGALILGTYEGGELKYVGHTGGGIPMEQMPQLRKQLEAIERETSPFKEKVKPNAPVHWVQPKLVCEISFSEWTGDGRMRQPIFEGMRSDKAAKEVHRERPADIVPEDAKPKGQIKQAGQKRHFEFSHLDKLFFPDSGYTKGDLANYYQDISEVILKYLLDRPHSLLRQPNGVAGNAFFQKDLVHPPDWLKTQKIYSESNDKDINYLVCDSADSLLYMVQLGCIEINPWNSRVDNLENPDWAVIDLDPEKIGFKDVIKVAQEVRRLCDELKIPSYPKTSGKTGLHIFIPLQARYDYEQVKQLAEILANIIHRRLPDITSIERSPSKRQGKVYVDFLQNRQGQTLAAPYSVRPTPAANVSTPLHWDEVNSKLDPTDFNIKNIKKRLQTVGELWCPVVGKGIDIAKTLEAL